jgi:hypothetical protein
MEAKNDQYRSNGWNGFRRFVSRIPLDASLLKGVAMSVSFDQLSACEQEFVQRVCDGLWNQFLDPAVLYVYGDGSASPNGEKFAAALQGAQVLAYFDFNKGFVYKTAIQLPVEA